MHMGAYRTLQRDECVFVDLRPESVLWLAPSSIHRRDLSNQWGMGFLVKVIEFGVLNTTPMRLTLLPCSEFYCSNGAA